MRCPIIVHCPPEMGLRLATATADLRTPSRSAPHRLHRRAAVRRGRDRLEVTEPYPNVIRVVPVAARARVNCTSTRNGLCCYLTCSARSVIIRCWPGVSTMSSIGFIRPWWHRAMLGKFDTAAVVYDCMDELANFRFAPPDLPTREATLLGAADVVFTGGYQLFTRSSATTATSISSDAASTRPITPRHAIPRPQIPADIASLPRPILGYFGVIDERLDYGLIESLAARVRRRIRRDDRPVREGRSGNAAQRPNLHWLGQRDYADLPAYTKGFDVCLMPFALNDATENINPTKTLEYMAAGKPVISTAVADVVRNFARSSRLAIPMRSSLHLQRGHAHNRIRD